MEEELRSAPDVTGEMPCIVDMKISTLDSTLAEETVASCDLDLVGAAVAEEKNL